jgi:hypothetical protein
LSATAGPHHDSGLVFTRSHEREGTIARLKASHSEFCPLSVLPSILCIRSRFMLPFFFFD